MCETSLILHTQHGLGQSSFVLSAVPVMGCVSAPSQPAGHCLQDAWNALPFHLDLWFRVLSVHRCAKLPLQSLKNLQLLIFNGFFRFLTSVLSRRGVGKVFMTSSYKIGLGRLDCSGCWSLVHWNPHSRLKHSSHETHACGHITYPDCFLLAGLRLFAILITCIRDICRAQFSP